MGCGASAKKSAATEEGTSVVPNAEPPKSEAEKAPVPEKKDEEDEEEDDDDVAELPPDFIQPASQRHKSRASVSAEAYGEWNVKQHFIAPVIDKTSEQKERLGSVLSKSFMFGSLEPKDLDVVIGAMKEVSIETGTNVINQEDDGDFLFVIESGTVDCSILQEDGSDKVVKTCSSGDVFGELALLYNAPRAASVTAKDEGILWQLDRETFSNIVKDAAVRKREKYEAFLSSVPILTSLENSERSKVADAIKVKTFPAGANIVNQDESGDAFYIIEEGEATAIKNGETVMSYKSGDYFGELALLKNQPREATVQTTTEVKALYIDNMSFNRMLKVTEALEKAAARYQPQV